MSLDYLNCFVGREIFITMLRGGKDSKIVLGKYYENPCYGIFSNYKYY